MDPMTLLLAALAAQAMGTYQQQRGTKKIQAEQGKLSGMELERQRGIDKQRAAAMDTALPSFGAPAQEQEQQSIAQKLQAHLVPGERQATAGEYVPDNPGAPDEIDARREAAIGDALAKGQDYAKRLSQMSAYNMLNFNTGVKMNRLGERTGMLNSESERSSSILPFELEGAKDVGRESMERADMLNNLGRIALFAYLGGAGAPTPVEGMGGGTGLTPGASGEGLTARAAGQGLRASAAPRLAFAPRLTF